jgi:ubiquitin fusion degradation protein 1
MTQFDIMALAGLIPRLRGSTAFRKTYRVASMSFFGGDRPHLEEEGKVILPTSALAELDIEQTTPMLFALKSHSREMHVGVLEFTAPEGRILLPYWMMENLRVEEGHTVDIFPRTLPKGKFAKFQPHTQAFVMISNPKVVLEKTLRTFSALTKGDVIRVLYNHNAYYLTVLETKPDNAISIIETDLLMEFAPALDAPPEEPPAATPSPAVPTPASGVIFGSQASSVESTKKAKSTDGDSDSEDEDTAFKAFEGPGFSLKKTAAVPIGQKASTVTTASPASSPASKPSPGGFDWDSLGEGQALKPKREKKR